MLTCIARPKQQSNGSFDHPEKVNPNNKQPLKSLTSQIKDMAMKASGAYKQCSPCTTTTQQPSLRRNGSYNESESVGSSSASASEKFRWTYKRTGSSNSCSSTAGRRELEARLKGISSGDVTPVSISASASVRRVEPPVVFVEENEPKEWVAQVEPGVLITFLSLPRGGNDLKRIRFSREMFNKWQAQRWWADNYEKVMELYNVQGLNRQAIPLPTPSRPEEDRNLNMRCAEESPMTPPRGKERQLPRALCQPVPTQQSELSSSVDTTTNTNTNTTSSSRDVDRSEELSISNVSELDTEWVEEEEPGVYITVRALPDGRRELRRVRFSREIFGEEHARLWWAQNRSRIHKQYL